MVGREHALKPTTMDPYTGLANNCLIPNVGGVRLLDLRAQHLDRMYAAFPRGRRGRPLSPSTIRRVHAVLRSALNTAVKRRLIPYTPAEHIELAAENRPARCHGWKGAADGVPRDVVAVDEPDPAAGRLPQGVLVVAQDHRGPVRQPGPAAATSTAVSTSAVSIPSRAMRYAATGSVPRLSVA